MDRIKVVAIKRSKGFTLVELLVVIAIIAVLLTLLAPTLQRARAQARGAVCLAHIKQFGVAWNYYAEDNEGYNISYTYSLGGFWFYQLGPYFGDPKFATEQGDTRTGALEIMNCPATHSWTEKFGDGFGYGASDMAWQWKTTTQGKHEGGYTLNGYMQQDAPFAGSYAKYDAAPSDTPLISDGGWVDAWPRAGDAAQTPALIDLLGSGILDGDSYRLYPNMLSRFLLARHGRAINMVFKDLHAENVPLEKLGSFPWHEGYQRVSNLVLPD